MDTTALGTLAAEYMEHIEQTFGDDTVIGQVAIVTELIVKNPDGSLSNIIDYACSDERRWFQVAFLREGLEVATLMKHESFHEEDEDDE